EAFLFCPNSHYSGKKTDYQTNKQKKTNIKRDVCLQSEALPNGGAFMHEYQEVAYDQNFSAIS
ncbi:hypothetical protein, partial [Streptococcus suis]|uniref:hypothetical protein n=1 Tax=Streptococcus suis TaxID=1307 RepID=UPI00137AFE85